MELRVRDILNSPSRLKDKVHTILNEIKTQEPDSEARTTLLKYLFNSGHFQELTAVLAEMAESQHPLPWDLLIEVLGRTQTPINGNTLPKSLLKGIERQEAHGLLWAAKSLDSSIPEFKEIRIAFAASLSERQHQKRNDLLEKFEFLDSQRLPQEARRVLRQLRASYPEDPMVKDIQARFEENWARDVLSERAANRHLDTQTLTLRKNNREDLELLQFWFEEMDLKNSSENNLDFALFFLFLDAPDLGLKFLNLQTQATMAMQWLKAELLKRAGRHIEALEQASVIEGLSEPESDSIFAVTYFKAEVFGEMGQFDKALELLESISKIRPNYRSINYLINLWNNRGSGF